MQNSGIKMNTKIVKQIEKRVEYLSSNKDNLVIDADTHITDTNNLSGEILEKFNSNENYYQGRPVSAEDLIAEMNMAKVDMSVCWQNPASTIYKSDDNNFNFHSLMEANSYVFESAQKYPERIIPTGWTDPKALGIDLALKVVDISIMEYGCLIVKVNPAQNQFPVDSEPVIAVLDRVVELGGILAFHYAADTPFTPPSGMEKIASRYPDHPIVGIHMGGGGSSYQEAEQMYHESRDLGLKMPNIRFIESAKRDTHIEDDLITYQLAGTPFCNNIFCASDAPYGRQTWNFGGYRVMFDSLIDSENHTDERVRSNPEIFTDIMRTNFMGRNAAEFIVNGYKKLLEKQNVESTIRYNSSASVK